MPLMTMDSHLRNTDITLKITLMIFWSTETMVSLFCLIQRVASSMTPTRSNPVLDDSSTSPIASFRLPQATFALSILSACADAEPLTCLVNSPRMIFCAPAISPVSIIALTCSSCCFVNDTPTRVSAVSPLDGSLSALPTMIADDCKSLPNATDRSRASSLAFVNVSPVTLPNVSSVLDISRRLSSSMPDIRDNWSSMFSMDFAVSLRPIDRSTAPVCASALRAPRASSMDPDSIENAPDAA